MAAVGTHSPLSAVLILTLRSGTEDTRSKGE